MGALPQRPLCDWGGQRWQEQLLSVLWLYDRSGDARETAESAGLRLVGHAGQLSLQGKVDVATLEAKGDDAVFMKDLGQRVHGVDIGMSIAMWPLVSGSAHHHLPAAGTGQRRAPNNDHVS